MSEGQRRTFVTRGLLVGTVLSKKNKITELIVQTAEIDLCFSSQLIMFVVIFMVGMIVCQIYSLAS